MKKGVVIVTRVMGLIWRRAFGWGWRLLMVLPLLSVAHGAEVYRCSDGRGGMLFQDRPCNGQQVVAPAAVSQGKHYFWTATAGKGRLHLLGSIHFGTPEMYPLPSIINSSFAAADALVVEANIVDGDPMQLAQLVAAKALYRDGTTLQQQLSGDTWRRLNEAATQLQLPVELLNHQKPWFVSMTLSALALKRLGYSEELGIDRYFLAQAQGRKRIIELESIEGQLNLFDRFTPSEQVAMLEETLRELSDGKAFFDRMLTAWKSGDAGGIQALFDESSHRDSSSERVNQLMITERNRAMTAVLERLATQGGDYFVVVGAGHLSGDEGIIALLQRHGYRVTQQ